MYKLWNLSVFACPFYHQLAMVAMTCVDLRRIWAGSNFITSFFKLTNTCDTFEQKIKLKQTSWPVSMENIVPSTIVPIFISFNIATLQNHTHTSERHRNFKIENLRIVWSLASQAMSHDKLKLAMTCASFDQGLKQPFSWKCRVSRRVWYERGVTWRSLRTKLWRTLYIWYIFSC